MAGVMAPDTVFSDRGGYQIPGCSGAKCYRSNAGGAAYGRVTIDRAITISSDAYFYNVGAQFWLQRDRFGGDDGMQNLMLPFGIGDATGVALTGEASGRVPTATWKREYCERVDCNTDWRTGDNVNMAIGQGDVLVTPLQLANGYATFANGGTRYVPQIALRAQAYQTGEVTQEFAPEVGRRRCPCRPRSRQPLLDGLANVPRSGTADTGRSPGSRSTSSPWRARRAPPRSTTRPTPPCSPRSARSRRPGTRSRCSWRSRASVARRPPRWRGPCSRACRA